MTQKAGLRSSSLIKAAAWVAITASAFQVVGACTNLKGSLGSDCIKDQDCQSNICSQEKCVAPPPLLDAAFASPDAGADSAVEGGADAGSDAPVDAGPDAQAMDDVQSAEASGNEASASSQGNPEAAADAEEESHADASIDAPADVTLDSASDARDDAADGGGPG